MKQVKKQLIFGLSCLLALTAQAQLVEENELAVVYYMPKTQVLLDINYMEETYEPGPFYMFAEEFLGASDFIEEAQKTYTLTSADINTRTIPDYDRAFKVTADDKGIMQLLTLTNKGILWGFNTIPEQTQHPSHKDKHSAEKPAKSKLMPLFEEQIHATTLRETAQGVAKQIYRIRETRLYLLSGEIENAPSDQKAMSLMLNKLDEQEAQLTELFIGTHKSKKMVKHITLMPAETERINLLYFSKDKGIVNDTTATPIVLDINTYKQTLSKAVDSKKKGPQPSQIYYNLPGSCSLRMTYDGQTLADNTLSIAQFGVAIPLAQSLFTQDQLPKIVFNPYSGNIESISK
ncbi:MAG: DUF4831 family protein [Paludibacteraceae bacterium]|nr:DUF4831 family protein [Paludibacteraceae bacterium]